MQLVLAVVTGGLYAAGVYLMMRRSIVKLILGLILLSHAANLLIFTSAGLTRDAPPVISEHAAVPKEPIADPLPQAFILTAIVIAFGIQVFTLVLLKRAHYTVDSDDLDDMNTTDRPPGKP